MNCPNLFDYATSELSQDAFLCWLLSWAAPEFEKLDKQLHECALVFIDRIFKKHGKKMPSTILDVQIRRQAYHIDVLCVINNVYFIIIEDKVETSEHSDQLRRYVEAILDKETALSENILPVYFKTGDQADLAHVESSGYKPFLRNEMLGVLCQYRGTNSILLDYREHLQRMDDDARSYQIADLSEWSPGAWSGFFAELRIRLGDGSWDYVPNQTGGFWGFWWSFHERTKCKLYLQLEENRLAFKIDVNEKAEQAKLRKKWSNAICAKAANSELAVRKPDRFGRGKHMTLCVLDGDYRAASNGVVDMNQTIDRLRKAMHLLKVAITKPGPSD